MLKRVLALWGEIVLVIEGHLSVRKSSGQSSLSIRTAECKLRVDGLISLYQRGYLSEAAFNYHLQQVRAEWEGHVWRAVVTALYQAGDFSADEMKFHLS